MTSILNSARAAFYLTALAVALGAATAAAAPSDQPSVQLVRQAAQPDRLSAALSRNVFRTEDYQADYDVQIPYQDTETYTVDVPYQDTETYTDYESYTSYENVCMDRTVYRQSCSQSQQCHEEHERQCSSRQECDPQGVCHQQEVCLPVGHQVCQPVQQCSEVPDTIRECHEQPVTRERPVTRTRTVTKYRQELRTREVTRYRTESRCCVTRQRQVFDHQVAGSIELLFPQNATLDPDEREIFAVSLHETGEVSVTTVSAIYTYKITVTQQSPGAYSAQLSLVPTYQPAELGPVSITALTLTALGHKSRLVFSDAGVVKKTATSYDLQLLDATSGALLAQLSQKSTGAQAVKVDLPLALASGTVVRLKLEIKREGIVIAAPVQFTLDAPVTVSPEPKYDAKPYMDPAQVGKFSLKGVKISLILSMKDLTPLNELVTTEYHLKLYVPAKPSPRLLAEKTFSREGLPVGADGSISLSLASDFGVSESELAKLGVGSQLAVVGEVLRHGSRFPKELVTISKKVSLTVH